MAQLGITDGLGNTAEFEDSIPTERVAFHLKEGGNGAAFGKVAETEYVLELAEDWELKGGKKAVAGILQTTAATDLGKTPPKVAVLDYAGRVYYRTPSELRADLGYGDYVLEQGTSGIWTYRKWNSGLVEYWGKEQGFTLEDGWHRSPAAPFTIVNKDYGVITVTNWYGFDDNRAARPNIVTCGGLYDDGSISVYDRNYDGTLGTGYRAYYYDVKAYWK